MANLLAGCGSLEIMRKMSRFQPTDYQWFENCLQNRRENDCKSLLPIFKIALLKLPLISWKKGVGEAGKCYFLSKNMQKRHLLAIISHPHNWHFPPGTAENPDKLSNFTPSHNYLSFNLLAQTAFLFPHPSEVHISHISPSGKNSAFQASLNIN